MAIDFDQASERFRSAFEALAGTGTHHDIELGLAVSGGPDSLALLLLAHRAMPGQFRVATVDHGLRPESADEARFVAAICAERGIAHDLLQPAQPITGNLQSAAREARYALLDQWAATHGLQWIATAHHADDQLETLLMRLARGSGVSGMSGIRAVNGRIIRPLLAFNKTELVEICASAGISPCHDPSNDRPEFDRVRMRQWLRSAPDVLRAGAVARTAGAIAEANIALEWAAAQLEQERVVATAADMFEIDVDGLPREITRRLLLRTIAKLDANAQPRGQTIDQALAGLADGKRLTVGDVMISGGNRWVLEKAPLRRSAS